MGSFRRLDWSPVEAVSRIVKGGSRVLINMASGSPDPSTIPFEELGEMFREVVAEHGPGAFAYPGAGGHPELVKALESYCEQDLGVPVGRGEVLVVSSGAQHGLKLLSQILLSQGDLVAVEDPTFYEAVDPMRFQGSRLLGVPVDEGGMRVEDLEALLRRGVRPSMVYVNPTCHNPTGSCMGLERRRRLLELAEEHDLLIVEDDPYRPIAPEAPPSLKSLDRSGRVVYVGTLSKILAPGLRIGFVVAPQDLGEEVAKLEQHDFSTSTAMQLLAAKALGKGLVRSRMGPLSRLYSEKLRILVEELEKRMPGRYTRPSCGFYTLARVGGDAEEKLAEALKRGLIYVPASRFFTGEGPRDAARLSISTVPKDLIPAGVEMLSKI